MRDDEEQKFQMRKSSQMCESPEMAGPHSE